MEEKTFWNMSFPYMIYESKMIDIWDSSIKMEVVRMNMLKPRYTDSIIITPNYMYYPSGMELWLASMEKTILDFMKSLHSEVKGEYTFELKGTKHLSFSKVKTMITERSRNQYNFKKYKNIDNHTTLEIDMTPSMYLNLVMSIDPMKKLKTSRFVLTYDELAMLNSKSSQELINSWSFLNARKKDDLKTKALESTKIRKLLVEYYETAYEFKPTKKKEETLSLRSEYVSVFSEYLREELTYKRLKFWEMSRHNIFGEVVCTLMDWEYEDGFDIQVSKKYDYWGVHYYKTPDYIIDTGDKVILLDFAVTTGNAGNIRDKKKVKYENLREGLSKHLKKEVRAEAIVWKINSDFEFQVPDEFKELTMQLNDNEVLKTLQELQIGFMMMKNYDKFRAMRDREEEDEENEDEALMEVTTRLLKSMDENLNIKDNLKCLDINDSRIEGDRLKRTWKKFSDTDFCKEMKEYKKMFKKDEYEANLVSVLENKCKNKEYGEEMNKVLNFNLDKFNNRVLEIKKEQLNIRDSFISNSNNSIPTMFKFPYFKKNLINSKDMTYFSKNTPDFWNAVQRTEDGTLYYSYSMDFKNQKIEEDKEKEFEYPKDGVGIDSEEDSSMVENLIDFFQESSGCYDNNIDYMNCPDLSESMKTMMRSNLWEYVCTLSDLMENLCYLEGRRHIFNKREGHTVFKNFGSYMLMIKKGSKLTQDKQIRYKIMVPRDSVDIMAEGFFKKWYDMEETQLLMSTKWLSMTVSDIKHFVKVKEVCLAMFSNMEDKLIENNRGAMMEHDLMTKSMMTQAMILLEHKRGTSTSSQLNRYLLNSATSYASNREKLLEDICSDPTRSRLEAYIKNCQIDWFHYCLNNEKDIWVKKIINMASTKTDYDRFELPSFYSLQDKVEFGLLMDEIYSCNMFEKSSGFQSHRMKRIVDKMGAAEIHYRKVRKQEWSKGKVNNIKEFLDSKDELHMFDRNFVTAASQHFFNEKRNQIKVKTAYLNSFSTVIDEAMMMTSSLKSGPLSTEALEFSVEVVKSKSFLTIQEAVNKLSTNLLVHMVNKIDYIDAVFTIFPKDQIGGAREILIQSIMLRLQVKYLESLSKNLCYIHPKEMLTKDKKKAELQSDKMMEYRELLKLLRQKGEISLYASFNSDASKWAPGFVMEHFSYFVDSMDLPDNIETMMQSVISAFSHKKMLLPESLKRKWEKKDNNEKEDLDGVQFTREMSEKLWGTVVLHSGMGQGMLHFLSSLYHAVMDDYSDHIMNKVLARVHNVSMLQSTLLSSDDKTKMFLMVFKAGHSVADEALKAYLFLLNCLSRLANIHTNWKKSGLNFIITEFNSLFSIGKRMQWATIKDIYTANSIPDLTSPEEAVVFMNANIRRCLEHGMYLTTIKKMMWMARMQILRYYKIDDSITNELCKLLDTEEKNLPYHLGYYNINLPVETLLYGMEITMFDRDISDKLKSFYHNIYSYSPGSNMNMKLGKKSVPFSEDCIGKYWFELPTKLDKKLVKMKNKFFKETLGMSPEEILWHSNKNKLNYHTKRSDLRHHKTFCEEFFVGMRRKYEFQESMVVHSLIRALQLSKSKGKMYPMTEYQETIEEEWTNINNEYFKKEKKGEITEDFTKEWLKRKMLIEGMSMDLLGFAYKIMKIDSKETSISMYYGLKDVVDIHYDLLDELDNMERSYKFTHATMRTLRMYMTDIGLSASKEEIVDYIFNKDTDFRSATVTSVNNILLKAKNLDINKLHSEPFDSIKKIMHNSEYPNKVFMEYLHLNYRSMKFTKINMLSDLPCEGNMKGNLRNLLRTKSNPNYILMPKEGSFMREDTTLDFLTSVSMKENFNKKNIPDSYYKISHSDNVVMKSMKLHSISKEEWCSINTVDSDRVEYRRQYKRDRDTMYHMWTNFNMLVKAEETKDNFHINIICEENMDLNNKNDHMRMILLRMFRDMVDKGKKINFMSRTNVTNDKNFMYHIDTIKWKTKISRMNTFWQMSLLVDSSNLPEKSLKVENMEFADFNLLKDPYTVNSKSMMEFEVIDEFDDKIKVKEMFNEVPDLVSLDKIFIKNDWFKKIKINTNNGMNMINMTDQERREYGNNIIDVKALNESYGVVSMEETLSRLISQDWLKEVKAVDEKTMEQTMGDNLNETVSAKVKNTEVNILDPKEISTLVGALKAIDNNELTLEIEYHAYERSSIVKNVDYLVSKSIKTNLIVYKDRMKDFYKYTKKKQNDTKAFHNILLFQIRKSLDFEVSDTMAIIIYNHIIRSSTGILEMRPIHDIVKLDNETNMPDSSLFVKKVSYSDNEWDMLLDAAQK